MSTPEVWRDMGVFTAVCDRRQEKKHYRVREDVFAVWSDGRRYPGSIQAVLPNGEMDHIAAKWWDRLNAKWSGR